MACGSRRTAAPGQVDELYLMQSQPTERIRLTKPSGQASVFRPLACLLYRTSRSLYRRLSGGDAPLRDRLAVFELSSASGQEETSPEVKQAALWKIRLSAEGRG
jgi:hypothetical protein